MLTGGRVLVVSLVASVPGVGCADDVSELRREFAVRLGAAVEEESIVLTVPECFDRRLDALVVYVNDGEDPLWRIDSLDENGSALRRVELGKVPPGFAETVALKRLPRDDDTVMVTALGDTSGEGSPIATVAFSPRRLSEAPKRARCGAG